jgi:hypothetical protein
MCWVLERTARVYLPAQQKLEYVTKAFIANITMFPAIMEVFYLENKLNIPIYVQKSATLKKSDNSRKMIRHASTYFGVIGLAYCWVSFVQAFGGKNQISHVPGRRYLFSDLGTDVAEEGAIGHQRRKCGPYHGLDAFGDCPYCLMDSCYECSANYKVCTSCRPGHEMINGSCKYCENDNRDSNAELCYGNCNTSNCSACFPGSFLTQQRTCIFCRVPHAFNGTHCQSCRKHCTKCKFTTAGTVACTECEPGDHGPASSIDLIESNCVDRCENCDECRKDEDGKFRCVGGCLEGAILNQENLCITCKTISPECAKCKWTGEKMECVDCGDSSILHNGSCFACPQSCARCILDSLKNKAVCITCLEQHAVLPNGTCEFCGNYCGTCVWKHNEVICNSCEYDESYAILQGKCIRCPQYCQQCNEVNGMLACKKVRSNHKI